MSRVLIGFAGLDRVERLAGGELESRGVDWQVSLVIATSADRVLV